jgi:tRNA pseudouridine-54 N-methylase
MTDKRSESQWPDINSVDHGDMPEGFGIMTPEAQDEQAQAELHKRHKIMPLSRNGDDIENSKRSRGERL